MIKKYFLLPQIPIFFKYRKILSKLYTNYKHSMSIFTQLRKGVQYQEFFAVRDCRIEPEYF